MCDENNVNLASQKWPTHQGKGRHSVSMKGTLQPGKRPVRSSPRMALFEGIRGRYVAGIDRRVLKPSRDAQSKAGRTCPVHAAAARAGVGPCPGSSVASCRDCGSCRDSAGAGRTFEPGAIDDSNELATSREVCATWSRCIKSPNASITTTGQNSIIELRVRASKAARCRTSQGATLDDTGRSIIADYFECVRRHAGVGKRCALADRCDHSSSG